jgi:transposase
MRIELRYDLRRVDCSRCGVRVERVPWAEPDSMFTRPFEEQVAYLAQRMDRTAITGLMGIAWYTVGSIAARIVARMSPDDRLAELRVIGIDELSYRRAELADVQVSNRPLYRAYLLKGTLASILDRRQYYVTRDELHGWLAWASRSKLAPFVRVARTIRKHLHGILAYFNTRLSKAGQRDSTARSALSLGARMAYTLLRASSPGASCAARSRRSRQ